MGRGYSHKPNCSLARPAGGNPKARRSKKRGRAGRPAKSTRGNGLDLRILKGMAVEELVQVRDSVTKFIRSKAPSIKAKIKQLTDTLSSIGG
jgi:hypothetical protein